MSKMFRHIKGFGLVVASVVLIAALLVGSVVPTKATEEGAVKIGHCAAFTGALATIGTPIGQGVIDYVRFVNEQGGVNGIKIKVVWEETAASLARIITTQKRLAEQGVVLVVGATWAQVPGETIVSLCEKQQLAIIDVDAMSSGYLSKPQWILASLHDWASLFAFEMKWVKENLWTEARPMKVGAIFYNTHAGWSQLDSVPYFKKMGIAFVGYEAVPFVGCIDTSTELLRLAGKTDWIYVTSYGATTTTIVKDAKRLELLNKGVNFMFSPQTIDECILAVVGTDADGWYGVKGSPNIEETERFPGLKTYAEKEKEYRGIEPEDLKGFGMGGWAYSMVGIEAIRLAIEKVGYENLTGRAVRDALFSLKDFDTGIIPPVTATEEAPFIHSIVEVCTIRKGKLQPIEWAALPPSLLISPGEFERALEK